MEEQITKQPLAYLKPAVQPLASASFSPTNLSQASVLSPVWDVNGNWTAVLARVPGGALPEEMVPTSVPWFVSESRWLDRSIPSVALPVGPTPRGRPAVPVIVPWDLSLQHVSNPIWRTGADDTERWRSVRQRGAAGATGLFWRAVTPSAGLHHHRIVLLTLLDLLKNDRDDNEITDAMRHDPTVVLAVLRIAHSLRLSHGVDIRSLHDALVALGRKQLYRWVLLMLFARKDSQIAMLEPQMLMAMHRASLMELVCQAAGGELAGLSEEAFLAGTVSLLDVVLLKSPAEIVAMISAGDATRDCVVREAGPLARALALARAIEESRFEAAGEIASALGLSPAALLGCQLSAMRWLCHVKEQSYL